MLPLKIQSMMMIKDDDDGTKKLKVPHRAFSLPTLNVIDGSFDAIDGSSNERILFFCSSNLLLFEQGNSVLHFRHENESIFRKGQVLDQPE
jgi:hypothetical protein